MFKLNNIKAPAGSNFAPKRKGLGIGSGTGKTGGRGHKGQRARSGANVGAAFEGGQMPLQRRSPKVGFNSPWKGLKVKIAVHDLSQYAGKDLKILDLLPKSLTSKTRVRVSIFGNKEGKAYPKSLQVHHIAEASKKILEAKGVKVEVVPQKDGARSVKAPRVRKKKA